MRKTAKDLSNVNWLFDEYPVERDAIKIGCLQRIADACELMAKDHQRITRDLEYYKQRTKEESEFRQKLLRKMAAAKGQITRLKRLLAEAKAKP